MVNSHWPETARGPVPPSFPEAPVWRTCLGELGQRSAQPSTHGSCEEKAALSGRPSPAGLTPCVGLGARTLLDRPFFFKKIVNYGKPEVFMLLL